MVIQLASHDDVDGMCHLLSILFAQEKEFTPNVSAQKKGLQTILDTPFLGQLFVAKEEGRIIGMVNLLWSISTALGEKVAWLEDVVVLPEYRSQGVGAALIAYALKNAKESGCKRITLLTDGNNEKAQAFYKRFGFQISTMQPMRVIL